MLKYEDIKDWATENYIEVFLDHTVIQIPLHKLSQRDYLYISLHGIPAWLEENMHVVEIFYARQQLKEAG